MNRRLGGAVPALGRLAVIAQIVAALAFVAVLLRTEGVRLPLLSDGGLTVTAEFADAGGLHGGERAPVLVAGVPSGWVSDVRLVDGRALATLQLAATARGVIRRDATVRIEPRSALEDLTVDISPGSPRAAALADGGHIVAGRTLGTVTLDRVVSVMDGDTRAQLTLALAALGHGLHGRGGELGAAVGELHQLLSPSLRVAGALAERRAHLASLVGSLARLGTVAAAHDVSLARSLSAGERTLATVAAQSAAVARTVSALPATLDGLNRALAGVRTLATPLVPTLSGLLASARGLAPALAAARGAVPAASALLAAGARFTRTGAGGLGAAAGTLGRLAPAAAALTPAIARLEPIVAAVNRRRDGIGQLGERFSGVLSTGDANGAVLRGLGTFEAFNPADFGAPGASPAERAVLAGQAVTALTETCLRGGLVACLVRYLVPGLPGAVR